MPFGTLTASVLRSAGYEGVAEIATAPVTALSFAVSSMRAAFSSLDTFFRRQSALSESQVAFLKELSEKMEVISRNLVSQGNEVAQALQNLEVEMPEVVLEYKEQVQKATSLLGKVRTEEGQLAPEEMKELLSSLKRIEELQDELASVENENVQIVVKKLETEIGRPMSQLMEVEEEIKEELGQVNPREWLGDIIQRLEELPGAQEISSSILGSTEFGMLLLSVQELLGLQSPLQVVVSGVRALQSLPSLFMRGISGLSDRVSVISSKIETIPKTFLQGIHTLALKLLSPLYFIARHVRLSYLLQLKDQTVDVLKRGFSKIFEWFATLRMAQFLGGIGGGGVGGVLSRVKEIVLSVLGALGIGKLLGLGRGAVTGGGGLLAGLLGLGRAVFRRIPLLGALYEGFNLFRDIREKGWGGVKEFFLGREDQSFLRRAFSQALRYGTIGAGIGSVIPGLGTGVGALVGGALGIGSAAIGSLIDRFRRARALRKGLGSVAALFESGGKAGAVSRDIGGYAYGAWQIHEMNIEKFLAGEGAKFAKEFEGLVPGTPEFNRRWKEVAEKYGNLFLEAQRRFILRQFYAPVAREAARLGFATQSRAVQEALLSIGVQHGRAREIMSLAASLAEAKGLDIRALSPAEQLSLLYEARRRYVAGLGVLKPSEKKALFQRYAKEEALVRALAQKETPPTRELARAERQRQESLIRELKDALARQVAQVSPVPSVPVEPAGIDVSKVPVLVDDLGILLVGSGLL